MKELSFSFWMVNGFVFGRRQPSCIRCRRRRISRMSNGVEGKLKKIGFYIISFQKNILNMDRSSFDKDMYRCDLALPGLSLTRWLALTFICLKMEIKIKQLNTFKLAW